MDYVVTSLAAVRLAALTETLLPAELSSRVGPMFDRVQSQLAAVHASLATPIATYAETEAGIAVVVGYAYDGPALPGLELVDLPAATAVCGIHEGPMGGIGESWKALLTWVADNDYLHAGPCREWYVRAESETQHDWITELQQPVRMK